MEVIAADDSDELPFLQHGKVTDAVLAHELVRLPEGRMTIDGERLARHAATNRDHQRRWSNHRAGVECHVQSDRVCEHPHVQGGKGSLEPFFRAWANAPRHEHDLSRSAETEEAAMKPARILVGYITRTGYVRSVAEAIALRLQTHGFETDVADLELCIRQPRKYDAVVLGCATRFGHHPPAMAQFIAQHRARLGDRPTAFFSVAKAGPETHATENLFDRTGWRPSWLLALQGIQGARLRRLRAWLQDRLDKRVSHVEAPTDWARIESFADQIAVSVDAWRASRSSGDRSRSTANAREQ